MQTFINNWPKVPGTDELDLAKAPFRLLAIVNRVDLRENLTYGGGSAGEARFVFAGVEKKTPNDPNNPNCGVMQFTVIFEFGIRKNGCVDLKAWAKQWTDLSTLSGPAFNAALETITESFVKRDADPAKPNGSALNQLRTNDLAFDGPWELREFQISAGGSDFHHLRQETAKQTPDISLNNSATITNYVTANAADIVADKHTVPLDFPPGVHFLGGAAPVPNNDPNFHWNGNPKIATYLEREKFSLATCNGCHAGETKTLFTHIKPAMFGTVAGLSSFLTGTPDTPPGGFKVDDPAGTTNASFFSDLKRRHDDLAALVGSSCFPFLFHRPLPMPH
jgi:hypothetical protein